MFRDEKFFWKKVHCALSNFEFDYEFVFCLLFPFIRLIVNKALLGLGGISRNEKERKGEKEKYFDHSSTEEPCFGMHTSLVEQNDHWDHGAMSWKRSNF